MKSLRRLTPVGILVCSIAAASGCSTQSAVVPTPSGGTTGAGSPLRASQSARPDTTANFTYYAVTTCCSEATGIANGPDGNVWTTGIDDNTNSPYHDAITVMTTSGSTIGSYRQFDTPAFISSNKYRSYGIASDGTNLWFGANGTTTAAGAYIASISPSGVFLNSYAVTLTNAFIRTVTAGPSNSIWFTGGSSSGGYVGTIQKGSVVTHLTKTAAYNLDMSLGPDGNMWFISANAPYVVGKVTPKGKVTKYKLPIAYKKGVTGLTHIVSANGALWVSLPGLSAIAEVTTAGAFTLFAQAQGAQTGPAWLTVSGTTIYMADAGFGKNNSGRYTLDTFDTTTNSFGTAILLIDPTYSAPGPYQPLIYNNGHVWFGSADQANNTSGLGMY